MTDMDKISRTTLGQESSAEQTIEKGLQGADLLKPQFKQRSQPAQPVNNTQDKGETK